MENLIFTVPGLGNSGEGHWQTNWENRYGNFSRIQQYNWDFPVQNQWTQALEKQLASYAHQPIFLVAHSMGCHTVAQWAQRTNIKIEGALLVAPPNVRKLEERGRVSGYVPEALDKLPFPSIVVASSNDNYASLTDAWELALAWGSRFVNVGDKGHINAQSNLEEWSDGLALLRQLIQTSLTKEQTAAINITKSHLPSEKSRKHLFSLHKTLIYR